MCWQQSPNHTPCLHGRGGVTCLKLTASLTRLRLCFVTLVPLTDIGRLEIKHHKRSSHPLHIARIYLQGQRASNKHISRTASGGIRHGIFKVRGGGYIVLVVLQLTGSRCITFGSHQYYWYCLVPITFEVKRSLSSSRTVQYVASGVGQDNKKLKGDRKYRLKDACVLPQSPPRDSEKHVRCVCTLETYPRSVGDDTPPVLHGVMVRVCLGIY